MGVIWAIVLGIAGSFLAAIIGQFIGWYKAGQGGKKEGRSCRACFAGALAWTALGRKELGAGSNWRKRLGQNIELARHVPDERPHSFVDPALFCVPIYFFGGEEGRGFPALTISTA